MVSFLSDNRIYQVRGHLRTSPKVAVKVEGSLYHRSSGSNSSVAGLSQQAPSTANILHPACVVNGSFISQTFQILYRNEDVCLSDMAQFRLHVLVDSHKVRPEASRTTSPPSPNAHTHTQRLWLTSFLLPVSTIDFFTLPFSLSSSSFRPFPQCMCVCVCESLSLSLFVRRGDVPFFFYSHLLFRMVFHFPDRVFLSFFSSD